MCWNVSKMIFRLLLLAAIAVKASQGQTCEEGWQLYDPEGMCVYPVNDDRLIRNSARDYCIYSLNADLVMIKNEAKNTFVTSLIAEADSVYWIGLSDRAALTWKWVDDTRATYFNWADGEPNENDALHEDCVEIYSSGYWNDEQCLGMANPICERAVGLTGPPPTTLHSDPPCPAGWYKFNDEQCILVVKDRAVFNNARDYCQNLQSDLVVIKTQELNDFIADLISGYDDDGFWIGLTDRREMYEFIWVDNTPLEDDDYDNWSPGEPNESDGLHEDCVEMLAHTGMWNDEQCVAPQKYICSRPTVIPSTTPAPSTQARSTHPPDQSTECGDGWMRYRDTCVLVVDLRLTFMLAQEYCQDRHANLIKLESQDMNNWLVDQTSSYNKVFWIGMYDRIEDNTFIWIDGTEPSFTNWGTNEPNNNDGIGEDCVEMRVGGTWNDEQCLAVNAFVCSKGFEEVPHCDIKAGWESYGDKCYLWISDTKNIYEATEYCTMMDGYVISINDADEQTFATSIQLRYANFQYWIGLSDENNKGTFTWQDGTNTEGYKHWNEDEGEPNPGIYPACGMIKRPNPDVWSVDDCSVKKRFICEREPGTCADGWILHGGECYQFNPNQKTWFDANFYCSSQGGWLGTILDGAENTFIAANMDALQDVNVEGMWIGYSDYLEDGTWEWVHDTSSTYTNWLGAPLNTDGVADCAYLNTTDETGAWNQMLCTLLAGFVCKIKAGSTVTNVTAPEQIGYCQPGWSLYDQSCYYTPEGEKTFTEAEAECNALYPNAHLASIHSNGEQSFITERLHYINDWTWIGLSDSDREGTWVWTDGTEFDYRNWTPGEPSNSYGNEDCIHLDDYFYKIGTWNDVKCNNLYRFICKMPKYDTPPVTIAPSSTPPSLGQECQAGWKLYEPEGMCVVPVYNRLIRNSARDYCLSMNADLVMIKNEAKNTFVTSVFEDGAVYWIGLSDRAALQWKWVDDTVATYFNWADGEPNEQDALHEDCVEIYSNGFWNDEQCLGMANPICERAVGLTGPPPTTLNYEPPCPQGSFKYNDELCIYVVTNRDTFNNARSYCRYLESDLVIIKSPGLNDFIADLISAYDDDGFWIGLTDRRAMYEFIWVDETPLEDDDYSNWAPNEPNESDGLHEDCVEMLAHTGMWNDEQCVAPQKYICSRPTVIPTTTPAPPTQPRSTHPPALSTECGDGWMRYQDTCVLVVGQKLTFMLAQEYCQDRHANLIKLESQDMNNWLVDQTTMYNEILWIGMYDRIEDNTFIWLDGTEPSFTNWYPGNPNNYDGIGEDCVEMYVGGQWNDEQCLALNAFACSKGYEEIPICDIKAGWEIYGDKCYKWVNDAETFDGATAYCSSLDGYVISINDDDEQTFATSIQLRYANLQYWIGLSDQDNRGTFTWQDGTGVQSYTNWNTDDGEPDPDVYPACGMIKRPNPDVWSVDECNNQKRFICEREQGTCADGWILHGGQCYQFNQLKRTWFDASYYCNAQGGWLGTVFDGAENTFIAANMDLLKDENVDSMWIGYSDYLKDGTWEWVHETRSTYENWQVQPVNTFAQADCAYLDTADETGAWYQELCTLLAGFVCKITAGSTVTPVTAPEKVGSCERGWALFDQFCYYTPTAEKSFTEAEAECNALFPNSHLASIHSNAEQSFITERLRFINAWTWIGLTDVEAENTWKWTDGTNYNYWNWAPGEPNNVNNEDCVHLGYFDDHQIGLWNDNGCYETNRYICKMPKYDTAPVTAAPPITLPPSDRCGTGWVYDSASNNCFKYSMDKLTWPMANDQCLLEGGHLTSITNPAESEFHRMSVLYYKVTYNIWSFWIGLHDVNMEDGYVWSDGAPVSYLNWDDGEPNDAFTGEDYVEILNHNGKWNDLHGDVEIGYSCKRNSFITHQYRVFPNSRLDTTVETPISNLWPEECALSCYGAGEGCRSFNYYRKTRTCSLLTIDQYSGSADLVPEFEDPYDYYERDFTGPSINVPTTIDPSYGCGQGETGYRGYCYTLVNSVASFNDMQGICELRSSNLVSIADNSEMNFVISFMQTGNTATSTMSTAWLGLSDMANEAVYAWTDGSEVTYTNWAAGQPKNSANDEDCVAHSIGMNGWLDESCTGTQHYGICKRPKRTSNVVAPSTEGCPTGWLKYMSSCYQLVTNQKIWTEARTDCLNKNGWLTIVNDKYEQAYLASLMGAIYTYSGDYWIGLSDTDIPGTYLWVDGSYPVLSAWAPSQPDNFLGDCVALISAVDGVGGNTAGLWFDERCTVEHNYICERPVDGTTAIPYTKAPVTEPSNVGCTGENVIGYGSYCYTPFELGPVEQLSWTAARTMCQMMGGDLASFHSKEEEAYIVSRYTPNDPETANYGFWLGINDMIREGGWEWSDGSAVVYVNWGTGEPSEYSTTENCVEMFFTDRGWNDLSCTSTRSYLCKTPKQIERPSTIPPIGVCPTDSDWQYFPPYCYYFSDFAGNNDRLSWSQAEAFCQQRGGHLTSITSSVENQALIQMAPIIGVNYWIGLYQEVATGGFLWSDGSAYTFENWDRGEPNNHNGEELCAELYRYNGLQQNGVWNDAACGVNTPFICKRMEDSVNPITQQPTETPTGGCTDGYFKYFNRCYRMGGFEEDDRYSWHDARTVCQGEGGNLVGIHSQQVQSLLTSMIVDISGDVWIGFSDQGSNGQYHWTDGKPAVYTNWFPGEPTGHISLPGAPVRNCVEMLNEKWYAGMWSDSECENAIGYLCEKDLDPDAPENPPEDTFCDDPTYYKYHDSCFKLDTTRRTFADAQEFCQNDGANLASIDDAYCEGFLEYMMYSRGVSDAWIGMQKVDGQYQWIDGWPVHVSFWGDGEPSQNDGEGCVILTDAPAWDDTGCAELHPTICRTTTESPPDPVEELPGYCPSDTTAFGSSCYHVPNGLEFTEWYTASYHCQQMGGELASIHSKDENEFIRSLVQTFIGMRNVWIGLQRGASGGFTHWNDGTPVDFVNWNNGEPTNDWRGNQEDCVEIYTNEFGTWKDEVCGTGSSYICKIPKYDNSTSGQPVNGGGLSGGAIAGIVIACVLVVTVVLLLIGYMMGMRSVPKLGPSSSSKTPSTNKDAFPTTPSGFDNVVYTPDTDQKTIQMDKAAGSVA